MFRHFAFREHAMRLSFVAAALLSAVALAAPAHAAGLSGMGLNLFGNYFHFGKPNLDKPPVKTITAGGMRMQLQHTKLADIRKAFGGTIQTRATTRRW
jgi:hypothetical protein